MGSDEGFKRKDFTKKELLKLQFKEKIHIAAASFFSLRLVC